MHILMRKRESWLLRLFFSLMQVCYAEALPCFFLTVRDDNPRVCSSEFSIHVHVTNDRL